MLRMNCTILPFLAGFVVCQRDMIALCEKAATLNSKLGFTKWEANVHPSIIRNWGKETDLCVPVLDSRCYIIKPAYCHLNYA